MYWWFQVRKQNADLRAANVQLGKENEWLLDYALEGDELLTVARGQRDRLNLQCDTLTREAAQALAEVYRLLLEATQARDAYRKQYEALQKKLNEMPPPEEEPQYTVVPAAERAKRDTNRKEKTE